MLGLGNGLGFNRVIGAPLLLDKFTGAAAAYSLRALSSTTTDVVRVRRSSDNAEQDFSPDEINDGSLATWVGNTASDNGYVTTWYDQSGNSNDATRATAASQPKIVDAGVLVTENGKAAIDFDGVDDFLGTPVVQVVNAINGSFTAFGVGKYPSTGTSYMLSQDGSPNRIAQFLRQDFSTNSLELIVFGDAIVTDNTAVSVDFINSQVLQTSLNTGTSIETFGNSLGNGSQSITNPLIASSILQIGARGNSVAGDAVIVQELIIYSSDQSSNKTNIESNINNHYSIY